MHTSLYTKSPKLTNFITSSLFKTQTRFPAAAQKETIFTKLFSLFFIGRRDENESEAKSNPQRPSKPPLPEWSVVDMDVDWSGGVV